MTTDRSTSPGQDADIVPVDIVPVDIDAVVGDAVIDPIDDAPEPVTAPVRWNVETTDLFRLLVESVRDYAIFMLGPTGHVVTWNAGAQRFKGYTADEIIGRHFSVFYPREDVQAGKCNFELVVASREGRFEDEGWRVRKDGTRFWANVVITAVRDRSNHLIGFAKVTRDLTARKQAEELRAARLAAEQASRAKDEFLAMLGHELRNPLAPIVTALQLIKLRGDHSASKEHEIIERQITHMVRLVDDLLDVSRISSGKIELAKRQLDLRDVVAKAIESASPLLEQRRHHFDVTTPAQPLHVEGDEARLVQVFTNLLNNAAKYTEPGGHIALELDRAGDHIVARLHDDGVGIDPDLLPRVFERFVQGVQSTDRSMGGLGLGLALVRSLVHLHDGEVEAHSAGSGYGSVFTVRLPAMVVPPPRERTNARTAALPRAQHPRRILIVDDNEDARLLLSEVLATVGHDVKTAHDGIDALEVVKHFAPDIAILDIGLPVMDGYELATRLRETMAATLRLIALTGYGQPADQQRSQSAGFDQHLVKPIDVRRLLDTIG